MSRDVPMLLSAPLVRAVLAGRKTQTRRLGARWRKVEVGNLLWVRETHAYVDDLHRGYDLDEPMAVAYRADMRVGVWGGVPLAATWLPERDTQSYAWDRVKWRPSIFMPRWASRITLDVVEVRRERLRAITVEDAVAEGIDMPATVSRPDGWPGALERFVMLWNAINDKPGKRWADNPEVTVVRFEVLP